MFLLLRLNIVIFKGVFLIVVRGLMVHFSAWNRLKMHVRNVANVALNLGYVRLVNFQCFSTFLTPSEPVLERKGMRAILQKKGKKNGLKRAKYLKIWTKVSKIWIYFNKWQLHGYNYRMHETARICPASDRHTHMWESGDNKF